MNPWHTPAPPQSRRSSCPPGGPQRLSGRAAPDPRWRPTPRAKRTPPPPSKPAAEPPPNAASGDLDGRAPNPQFCSPSPSGDIVETSISTAPRRAHHSPQRPRPRSTIRAQRLGAPELARSRVANDAFREPSPTRPRCRTTTSSRGPSCSRGLAIRAARWFEAGASGALSYSFFEQGPASASTTSTASTGRACAACSSRGCTSSTSASSPARSTFVSDSSDSPGGKGTSGVPTTS